MAAQSALDALNRQTIRKSVTWYATNDDLNAPEKAAFASVAAEFRNKRILDLGVGAGRTTPALIDISSDYVGIDYVAEMVTACRARFQGVRFEHMDARSMPRFSDQSFDLIVFACNGISMVDHEGRLAILKEIRRLLTSSGMLVFSTYNRASDEHDRWFEFPKLVASKNPARLAANTARFVLRSGRSLINRLRYMRHEVRTEEYTILNDRCHEYATMLYYITLQDQLKQLQRLGFTSTPTVYDSIGRIAAPTSRSDSLTYVVRG
jgi:ubiquinone/menaquinone biosynthesis C-methylase UbiE